MKTLTFCLSALAALIFSGISRAQVPQIINDQGRFAVGTTNFNGTGAFKFAHFGYRQRKPCGERLHRDDGHHRRQRREFYRLAPGECHQHTGGHRDFTRGHFHSGQSSP